MYVVVSSNCSFCHPTHYFCTLFSITEQQQLTVWCGVLPLASHSSISSRSQWQQTCTNSIKCNFLFFSSSCKRQTRRHKHITCSLFLALMVCVVTSISLEPGTFFMYDVYHYFGRILRLGQQGYKQRQLQLPLGKKPKFIDRVVAIIDR